MSSFLSWIDHDPQARERMTRILALFQEKESRDELGLGSIRDALADLLFPGTSTIQSRLRYMLFIPWMYRRLEADGVSALEVAKRARNHEVALVQPLLANDPEALGVFGARAQGTLKRLPSSVYWAGLGSWGILRFAGSQEDYHRAFDRVVALGRRKRGDDGDVQDASLPSWDPSLPPAPDDWPKSATFGLRRVEAEYLRDKIVISHPRSLLAWLAQDDGHEPSEAPWLHPRFGSFPSECKRLLFHARLFSSVMLGAALLYNRELAKLKRMQPLAEEHDASLVAWSADVSQLPLSDWNLDELWAVTAPTSHQISQRAKEFVTAWVALVRSRARDIGSAAEASNLVRSREMALKGQRSRFTNQRALDQWSGYAGTAPMFYRWPTIQRFMADLHAGLGASRKGGV